ncbi:MAG TPA: hypothetical protein VIJ85_02555 [Rhizomicrobium sp.]
MPAIIFIVAATLLSIGLLRGEAMGRTNADLKRSTNPTAFWAMEFGYAVVAAGALGIWFKS